MKTLAPPFVASFVPSPTGELHLGHALVAYFNWRMAKSRGGRFILLMDDVDSGTPATPTDQVGWSERGVRDWLCPQERSCTHYAKSFLEDLEWLGLAPNEVRYSSDFRGECVEWGGAFDLAPPTEADEDSPFGFRAEPICAGTGPAVHTTTVHSTLAVLPWSVLSWAVQDRTIGVTGAVWGGDLWQYSALYLYFAMRMGGPCPELGCAPLVFAEGRELKMSSSDMSGTGAILVSGLRESGFAPDRVMRDLMYCYAVSNRRGALIIPKEWLNPTLGPEASRRWTLGVVP